MEWPLGDAQRKACKLKPHEFVVVDVRADWDPMDDWVKETRYSLELEFESESQGLVVLDKVRAELRGMLDHALTAAIDNAKEARAV